MLYIEFLLLSTFEFTAWLCDANGETRGTAAMGQWWWNGLYLLRPILDEILHTNKNSLTFLKLSLPRAQIFFLLHNM